MINPNDNAYPSFCGRESGLTKRERFALAALQGLCANPEESNTHPDDMAILAATRADALIRELSYGVENVT